MLPCLLNWPSSCSACILTLCIIALVPSTHDRVLACSGCGNYIFGALASFGIGQAFSAIPNTLDCAACVDCHPREKVSPR